MKTDKSKEDLEIKVDSETLECVPQYVCLGSTVSGDGNKQAVGTKIFVEWSRSSN